MMIIYDLSVYDLRQMISSVYDLWHMIICMKPYMIWTYNHIPDLYMIICSIRHMIPYMIATSNHIPKSDGMVRSPRSGPFSRSVHDIHIAQRIDQDSSDFSKWATPTKTTIFKHISPDFPFTPGFFITFLVVLIDLI